MATIGELIINLNASTASFVTELNRVKNLSFDTAAQIQRSFALIGTAALGMISVAAGALVVGIQKTAEWEVHILHLAQSAGTSVETMSGLSYAAKMMGLEIDKIATALERFDKQVLMAQLGNAKAAQNISLLGVDPKLIKTSDDALMMLADHISKLPEGALKAGEAAQAFGVKAGPAMVPLLNLGAKGIRDFLDEAKAMGIVISKDQAEQAEIFEQNITRMKESLHGLWVEITNATLPALNDLGAHFADTQKTKGLWQAFGEFTNALMSGQGAMIKYAVEGGVIIGIQEKMRPTVKALTLEVTDHQKAVDALKKSVDAIITSLKTQTATIGMTAVQIQAYKIATDATKLGLDRWAQGEIALYLQLQKKLDLLQQLALIDNQTRDEQKKNFLADKLKADQDDLDVLGRQLDVMLKMPAPQGALGANVVAQQATEAFTDSITAQTAALEHHIATFGMTAEAIARYDLAQLDSSDVAQKQIANFKLLQDRMAGMEAHAKALAGAWKQFGDVALRSLDDLIFSGKSFAQVLADITKQLGEMFLKWALFGFGDRNTSGGGGLFGSLFGAMFGGAADLTSLGGIPDSVPIPFPMAALGFAAGGPVSASVPIMVGENGPEIFMPSTAGAIIPNGAGGGPAINIVYNIDARGSSITEEQFRRSLAVSENNAVKRALNLGREAQLRSA